MMSEQCKAGMGYLTVYRGARAALVAAGVPEQAFSADGSQLAFQLQTLNVCCTGRHELLKGTTQAVGDAWELEVDWGLVRPYMQAAHPAVCELARMMLKDLRAWIDRDSDPAAVIDRLAADPRASDFKPGASVPRLQVTPEFQKLLAQQASMLFELVHTHGEVFQPPDDSPRTELARPALQLLKGGRC